MTTIYHPPPFQRGNIAQRIIGRLIKDGQKAGEIADEGNITGNNQYGNVPKEDISTPATLEELGLTRKQSSIYQLAEPYMKEAKFRQEATLKQNRDTVFPISEKREEPIHTVELLAEKAGRKEA